MLFRHCISPVWKVGWIENHPDPSGNTAHSALPYKNIIVNISDNSCIIALHKYECIYLLNRAVIQAVSGQVQHPPPYI